MPRASPSILKIRGSSGAFTKVPSQGLGRGTAPRRICGNQSMRTELSKTNFCLCIRISCMKHLKSFSRFGASFQACVVTMQRARANSLRLSREETRKVYHTFLLRIYRKHRKTPKRYERMLSLRESAALWNAPFSGTAAGASLLQQNFFAADSSFRKKIFPRNLPP